MKLQNHLYKIKLEAFADITNQLHLANDGVEKVHEELGLKKLNKSLYGR